MDPFESWTADTGTLTLALTGAIMRVSAEKYPASLRTLLDGLRWPGTFSTSYNDFITELGRLAEHHRHGANTTVEELCLPEGCEEEIRYMAGTLNDVLQTIKRLGLLPGDLEVKAVSQDITPGELFNVLRGKLATLRVALDPGNANLS
jgi:hypothetical protein